MSCEHGTSRVVREELDGTLTVVASHYAGLELNSPNDIVEDRQGRLYFTDPPYGRMPGEGVTLGGGIPRPQEQPVQGVYRVDSRDGAIVRLADDFDKPNGLCFSLDEQTLFVSDTARGHIRRFSVADDMLSGGEVWANVKGEGKGVPDGLKIDSKGNVYSCGPDGVHVFSPDAEEIAVVRDPGNVRQFQLGRSGLSNALPLLHHLSLQSPRGDPRVGNVVGGVASSQPIRRGRRFPRAEGFIGT